jgi:hypothetical protein
MKTANVKTTQRADAANESAPKGEVRTIRLTSVRWALSVAETSKIERRTKI